MKFISLCFANVVNIKGICNKKNRKKGLTASKSVFYKKSLFRIGFWHRFCFMFNRNKKLGGQENEN